MKLKLNENLRTLREFYPEPSLRHQVHYSFAHRFLPQYIHDNPYRFFSYLYRQDMPGGPMEPTRFIQSRWMMFEQTAGLVNPGSDAADEGIGFRRVSDLRMSLHELGGRAGALIEMPPAEQPAEACFIAAVLLAAGTDATAWAPDVRARVFTLEAMAGEPSGLAKACVICEWTSDQQHRNSRMTAPPDGAAFLRAVTAMP